MSEVVARSNCPVGVLVNRGLERVHRVLVAYAGGPEDLAALELARRIGRARGTSLTLFHVVDPGGTSHPGRGRSQIAKALGGMAAARHSGPSDARVTDDHVLEEREFDAGSIQVRVVEHSSPADAVLEETKRGYDLVILGMHARWGLDAGLISWRRRRVLAEAPVSILAVHPPLGAVLPGKEPSSDPVPLVSSTAS